MDKATDRWLRLGRFMLCMAVCLGYGGEFQLNACERKFKDSSISLIKTLRLFFLVPVLKWICRKRFDSDRAREVGTQCGYQQKFALCVYARMFSQITSQMSLRKQVGKKWRDAF